VWVFESGDPKG